MLSTLSHKVEGNEITKKLELTTLLDNVKGYISDTLTYFSIDSILTSILEFKGNNKKIRKLKKIVLDYNALIEESNTDKGESEFMLMTTQICDILDELSDIDIYNIFAKTRGEVMSTLLKKYNNNREYYETLKI